MNRNWKSIILVISSFFALTASISATPGDLDPTFGNGGKLTDWLSSGDEWGRGVAVQADGKIVVAGSESGNYDFSVVRYNADGSLDQTFGAGGKVTTDFNSGYDQAYSVAIQADGKIVVAGSAHIQGNDSDTFGLVRYNSDGTLDTSFGTGGRVTTVFGSFGCTPRSVAIQANGRIVAAGSCWGNRRPSLARYDPDGSLDPTFGSSGKVLTDVTADLSSVAIQADGKIVAAGTNYTPGPARVTVFRYNFDGSLDASFDGDGMAVTTNFGTWSDEASFGRGVAIQGDGRIVIVGMVILNSVNRGMALARFRPNGTLEQRFARAVNGWAEANSVTIQPDGKIVAAGSCSSVSNSPGFSPNYSIVAVRLNTGFSVDSTFGSSGNAVTPIGPGYNTANAVVSQPDGKIIAAGNTGDPLNADLAVIRYNTNGSLDTSFDGDGVVTTDFGNVQGNVFTDTAIQPDGKIVASGTVRGRPILARYLPDGTPDTTFGAGTGKVVVGFDVVDFAIQSDGKIVTAGIASDLDGNWNGLSLGRYNPDGSGDTTFGSGGGVFTPIVVPSSMLVQPDGKIVVAGTDGHFTIIRFNSDGSFDNSFDDDGVAHTSIGATYSHDYAKSIALQQDGKIVATGYSSDGYFSSFTTVRYNTNGSLDTSFDGDGIVQTRMLSDDFAEDVVVQSDGKIVVGGCTSTASNSPCDNFALARYNPDGSLDTTFDGDGRVITPLGEAYLRSLAIESDGKIVAAGYSKNGTKFDFTLARYTTNGSLDSTFGSPYGVTTVDFDNSNDVAYGMALDAEGRAVVVGESNGAFALARFLLTPATCSNPIDCPDFFVRQHYLDFLGREPDAGGQDYWTQQIADCGSDQRCSSHRRIGVSGAFFGEPEFQRTGSFVYRLYTGGLGRRPSYSEFESDRHNIVEGPTLEQTKQAFTLAFVQRSGFIAAYSDKTTADLFVDALIARIQQVSGVNLAGRRSEFVSVYANGADQNESRAQVLRLAIDDPGFTAAEYNPSFVLMEYFGYLHRDPDQAGYDFWLDIINNREPNNYRGMICAFITSQEYQLRFGSTPTRSNADCGQ